MTFNELSELLTEKEKTYELIFVYQGSGHGIDELVDTDGYLVTLATYIE